MFRSGNDCVCVALPHWTYDLRLCRFKLELNGCVKHYTGGVIRDLNTPPRYGVIRDLVARYRVIIDLVARYRVIRDLGSQV